MDRPIPDNEAERLAALGLYKVLDTPPEFAFDALTELAAEICHCPVAVVGLIDESREWFKSRYGLPPDFTECPREMVVCTDTICRNDLLYVTDLTRDDRFKDLPLVIGEPYLKFYCGMPLINADGYALGTLCVVDFEPRELSPSQQEAVRRLAQQAMAQLELRRQVLERDAMLEELEHARTRAAEEQTRADQLLRTVLPVAIAEELKSEQRVRPRYFESVTVIFTDFRNFTRLTEGLDPARLVQMLDQQFGTFDRIAERNRLETLKTIGDAYMCAGGLPEPNRSHPIDACLAALEMQRAIAQSNRQREKMRLMPLELRVGVSTGSAVAGIVGTRRFSYDLWGDAVNLAQRLEAASDPGRVNISASTAHRVKNHFEVEPRGEIEVKNKGPMEMFYLGRIKPEFSADPEGARPNEAFRAAAGIG
ncbi:MAG TPA: adenylate/guanylate cyclase domain-containing protein [Kiloniellales bacterium]|nr:adenylate/guanylate cyclase domain-containing protein [Kiloniellales bacterium]